MYPFFPKLPSHPGYCRTLSRSTFFLKKGSCLLFSLSLKKGKEVSGKKGAISRGEERFWTCRRRGFLCSQLLILHTCTHVHTYTHKHTHEALRALRLQTPFTYTLSWLSLPTTLWNRFQYYPSIYKQGNLNAAGLAKYHMMTLDSV